MAESNPGNAAQREYWNNVAGPRWVGFAGYVERRVEPVNRLLLARSRVSAGEKVLEIGCGTGATTVALAEAVGNSGEVLAADISEPMLSGARKRIAESGLRNIALVQADAQTHAFGADRFDLITSRFGVMFFADPAAAFRNLLHAAKPGGRLCFACWAGLRGKPALADPVRGRVTAFGNAGAERPAGPGPMAYSDPDYVRAFLTAAGFAQIAIDRETPDIIGTTPDEEAEHACVMGPSGRLIDEKRPDEAVRRTMRREMIEAFAAYAGGGPLRIPSTVLVVTAQHGEGRWSAGAAGRA